MMREGTIVDVRSGPVLAVHDGASFARTRVPLVSGEQGRTPSSVGDLRECGMEIISAMTTKERVLQAVQSLPDDASIEDVMERLLFLAKIETGLRQADAGQTIPHA